MRFWQRIGGTLLATAMALTLSGCAEMFPERYRVELIVEVDTPLGLRSGSSVYEVWASNKTAFLPDEAKRDWGVRGEAVAVDLPNGLTLFALLKTNAMHGDMIGLSMTALDPAFRNDVVETAKRIASGAGVRRQAEVAPEDYPMLVTFRVPADPGSVQEVTTASFSSIFGEGYALRNIEVKITDAAVTMGIQQRFPWWSEYTQRHFDGSATSFEDMRNESLAAHLSVGNFSTEQAK